MFEEKKHHLGVLKDKQNSAALPQYRFSFPARHHILLHPVGLDQLMRRRCSRNWGHYIIARSSCRMKRSDTGAEGWENQVILHGSQSLQGLQGSRCDSVKILVSSPIKQWNSKGMANQTASAASSSRPKHAGVHVRLSRFWASKGAWKFFRNHLTVESSIFIFPGLIIQNEWNECNQMLPDTHSHISHPLASAPDIGWDAPLENASRHGLPERLQLNSSCQNKLSIQWQNVGVVCKSRLSLAPLQQGFTLDQK